MRLNQLMNKTRLDKLSVSSKQRIILELTEKLIYGMSAQLVHIPYKKLHHVQIRLNSLQAHRVVELKNLI